MVNRFEDLAPIIAPRGIARGSTVGFRQGVVETWNTATGANTIRIGGTLFSDLPIIASSSEAVLIQPGDAVAIKVVSGTSAFATMYVEGRVTVPGTPDAVQAFHALANNIYSASVDASGSTTLSDFDDLTGSPGPAVTNVRIGPSGKALVFVTAGLWAGNPSSTPDGTESYMSFEVRVSGGAVVLSPSLGRHTELSSLSPSTELIMIITRAGAPSLVTGLSAGLYDFTAKYRASTLGGSSRFAYRNLTVIAL